MNRYFAPSLLLGSAALLAGTNIQAQEQQPKNILLIISDQLSWQALGVYGDKTGSTPTVDSLGHSGVAFSQAYTSCPLSMPARAALWTGQFPHTTGIESNGRNWPLTPVSEDLPTIGEVFSQNGYECVHFGKQHDNGTLRGFDCSPDVKVVIPDEFKEYPLTGDSYKDVNTNQKAVEYLSSLDKDRKDPFFCVVDINNPHDICSYIGAFMGKHDNPEHSGELPELPANFVDPHPEDRPFPVQYMCCSHRRLGQTSEWDGENYRHYLAAYYYYANRMDKDVNRVMQALRESGHADNTLIVFMADHGEGMAAKRMVTKQGTPYDQTTRVPLLFSGNGVPQAKKAEARPLVNVSTDVFPTLCEYAGIEAPASLPGESLLDWTKGKKGVQREYVCTEWTTEWGFTVSPFRMIRSARYKYVRYIEDQAEELFDIKADPLEVNNLADNPKFKKVLEQHRAYLAEHIADTKDNFYSKKVYWDPRVAKHPVGYHHHEGLTAPELPKE